jgi:NAD-dependent deacetylase
MTVAEVRGWIREAKAIAVLTGAGVSQESGVPTFRDAQTGLWARFRPEQLATEEAFRADPAMVWDWYAMRRGMVARVSPNAGHLALARFQQAHPGRLTLITQNVDGLHQRAGSTGVLALHGTLHEDKWLDRRVPAARRCRRRTAGRPAAQRAATCAGRRGVVRRDAAAGRARRGGRRRRRRAT